MTISFESLLINQLISEAPDPNLGIIICIPSYNEGDISDLLQSLNRCAPTPCVFEVIILINESEEDNKATELRNIETLQSIHSFQKQADCKTKIHAIYVSEMPKKHAGVGLARKIAMDLACERVAKAAAADGIIICLDADCLVSANYLNEVYLYFENYEKIEAASIHFAHRLSDNTLQNQAIIEYELHLRYFINMQRLLKLPFAFQTVGSSMAVRASAYKKEGGMNKRKAAEDFYFLHKFTKKGTVGEIKRCTVFPSSRISERVPFGTGRAIKKRLAESSAIKTYNYQSFSILQDFLKQIPAFFSAKTIDEISVLLSSLSPQSRLFFIEKKAENRIWEIKKNTKSLGSFTSRFYRWFDAFMLMKYLHFMREKGIVDLELNDALPFLFAKIALPYSNDLEENLSALRSYDRNSNYANLC